jgi:GNAT superfamily N-acetyltransferase
MTEIRPVERHEWGDAIKLADRIFRDREQTSMAEAFPYSFSGALSQSIGAFEQGRLVSFTGLVPAVMQVGPARLHAFLLGQVCTDPAFRGKGYASQVMDAVVRHIGRSGASLMYVSGSRSLYERNGCFSFGRMHTLTLTANWAKRRLAARDSGIVIRKRTGTDWLGISSLYHAKNVRFEYSVWDIADLIQAEPLASCMKQGHDVLAAESDGELAGFLVYTVPKIGIKTTRVPKAIEWAGDGRVVGDLLAHAIAIQGFEALQIGIPSHEEALLNELKQAGDSEEKTGPYPGTVHIANPARLLRQLEPYFRSEGYRLPEDYEVRKAEDGSVILRSAEGEESFTAQQWIEALFSPDDGMNNRLAGIFTGIRGLPVPLPSPHGLLYV